MTQPLTEVDVVRELPVLAVEVLVVELAAVTNRSAAGLLACRRGHVSVAIDIGLDERVVRRLVRDRRRHREQSKLIESVDIEPRADVARRFHRGDVVGTTERVKIEAGELERHVLGRVDDPRSFSREDRLPELIARPCRRRRGLAEQVAAVEAMGISIAEVDQDRIVRCEGQLAEAFVTLPLVRGQRAVVVGAVLARVLGPVVRSVEEQLFLEDRTAAVEGEPLAILFVTRAALGDQARHHVAALVLVSHLAAVAVGAGLARGVDRESTGAVEIDRPRAPLDRRDLRDVVRRRLGRQGAEQRQRDIRAVELVDVVLAAATGARSACSVLRELHAGNQLDQVAIFLADRQGRDLFARDATLDRRGVALDKRRRRRHGDGFRQNPNAECGVGNGVLAKLHQRLPRHGLHAGELELQGVGARRQRRHPEFTVGAGGGHTRRR